MKTSGFVVAMAFACVACVKVSDDVKATFAEHQPGEVDNFSPSSPHSIAPPDPVLTQAALTADASTNDASASTNVGICLRDETTSALTDAGSPLTSNCMQDAGNP
jgi:hypothetical protein